MGADSITAVQRAIDAKAYPPTHQYDVRTLEPKGSLRERVRHILELCPDFFRVTRFLDVGCSKGFFSLRAAREGSFVVALDPDAEALAAWEPICPPNVIQLRTTFRRFRSTETYDMVWVGNGHHYLHREDPDGWLEQLAGLAGDRVILEGPTGKHAAGFEDWAEGTVPEEAEWLERAERLGFELDGRRESTSYTPGRAMWLLTKTR